MKILITGGAGFIGSRLARSLLARGTLAGQPVTQLVLADLAPPRADLLADSRVQARTGRLLDQAAALGAEGFDGVFHLASAVSGECEADFDLGLSSNLDSTRSLLDALRGRAAATGQVARLVFSSSVAVYGPDDAHPLPATVTDTTLPTPQTSYGVQKYICEQLVADYTRKGYLDGRSARLMTVTVRPGKPNGAASSFFSGIVREPLAGVEAICPVSPEVSHPVSSPQRTVDGLIAVYEASRETFCGRTALNLPALNVTVAHMLDALERVAGIVARWPSGARADRAAALGLLPEASFDDIIRQYIADNAATPEALRGLG